MKLFGIFLSAVAVVQSRGCLVKGTWYTTEDQVDPKAYCQASYPSLATYRPEPGYELVSVQLFTRHGDRVPYTASLVPEEWECQSTFVKRDGFVVEKREAVNVPCAWGELTTTGASQMLHLGEAVGTVYKGFVQGKQDVSIRSTDSTRCIESVVAFMTGFLPQERDYEVITFPKKADDLLYNNLNCPRQRLDSQAIETSSKEAALKEYVYKLHPELKDWVFPNHGFDLSVRTDLLKAQYCHGKAIPTIAAIFSASNANYRHLLFDGIPPHLHRMRIGNILLNIKHNILNHTAKFRFYSAHDVTLAALLSALSIRNTRTPPYAASLLIELWAPLSDEAVAFKDLRLRFIYNGQQVTAEWCHIHCSVAAFLDYMDTHLHLVGGFETTCIHPKPHSILPRSAINYDFEINP